jgi:hypothetical protein
MWRCGLVLIAACSSKGGSTGGGGGNFPPEMAGFTTANALDAWQGAWTTRMNLSDTIKLSDGVVALDIKGDGAKAFDGKQEIPLGFELDSPCTATFKQPITEGALKGGTSSHTKQFVIKDGKVLAAEGAAGMRKGKTAVVCTIGMETVHTIDDKGACKSWNNTFDRWSGKDEKCAWSSEGGKDVLTVGDGSWSHKLVADGDLLMDEQFSEQVKRGVHTKQASFEAAKAALPKP